MTPPSNKSTFYILYLHIYIGTINLFRGHTIYIPILFICSIGLWRERTNMQVLAHTRLIGLVSTRFQCSKNVSYYTCCTATKSPHYILVWPATYALRVWAFSCAWLCAWFRLCKAGVLCTHML